MKFAKHSERTAGLSTTFGAEDAPNCAQDDTSLLDASFFPLLHAEGGDLQELVVDEGVVGGVGGDVGTGEEGL